MHQANHSESGLPNWPVFWTQVCVQLGDVVPFRLHWPRGVDLRANNMQYRPYGRNPSHKLGNNARDDAANIGAASEEGCVTSNKHAGAPAARRFLCLTRTLCNLADSLLCCAVQARCVLPGRTASR